MVDERGERLFRCRARIAGVAECTERFSLIRFTNRLARFSEQIDCFVVLAQYVVARIARPASSRYLATSNFHSEEKRRCRTMSDTGKECGWQTRNRETLPSRTARLGRASGRTRRNDNTPCANNNHSENGLIRRCDACPGAIIRSTAPETTDNPAFTGKSDLRASSRDQSRGSGDPVDIIPVAEPRAATWA